MTESICNVNDCNKNINRAEHFQCPFERVRTVIQDFAMWDKKLQWQISLSSRYEDQDPLRWTKRGSWARMEDRWVTDADFDATSLDCLSDQPKNFAVFVWC